jgi:glycosyltransferase involved in cell wall biosynthesis
MGDKKPLLSICIPTYNRANVLDKSIASIVIQPEFSSDDVELVVSDNASDDDTEQVVKKYQKKYKNVFYSKNSENIQDKNFPIVIGQAHGAFRKLCNDTLIFKSGSVGRLIHLVKNNISEKPILFFLNGSGRKKGKLYSTSDFEDFIKTVSFYSTWVGGFGIWENDYNDIEDKFSGCESYLWQTVVLLEMCLIKKRYLIENAKLFDVEESFPKNLSYGLYKVFYENYLGLCQKILFTHNLSKSTFCFLKKDILVHFFLPWIINVEYNHEKYILAQNENLYQLIKDAYKQEPYYNHFMLKLRIFIIKRHVKGILLGD